MNSCSLGISEGVRIFTININNVLISFLNVSYENLLSLVILIGNIDMTVLILRSLGITKNIVQESLLSAEMLTGILLDQFKFKSIVNHLSGMSTSTTSIIVSELYIVKKTKLMSNGINTDRPS